MAASLDGFIARTDGRVDWLETSDEFADGESLDPGFVEAFLKTIDCYVMGSRTYETALNFEAKGFGWSRRVVSTHSQVIVVARDRNRLADALSPRHAGRCSAKRLTSSCADRDGIESRGDGHRIER
jgi:dihydrofolate reductase